MPSRNRKAGPPRSNAQAGRGGADPAEQAGPGSGGAAGRAAGHKSAERAAARIAAAELAAEAATEAATQKLYDKLNRKAAKLAGRSAHSAEVLDRLAAHLSALEVWTRSEPGTRRPRLSRADIAEAAMRIADSEGFEAVSMRRIAIELGAGTMTLYHYVRTKDELLSLVLDALMGEVVVPADEPLPKDWRAALTLIADRGRAALRRHPWALDIADDPQIGPNSMLHFDQSWQAVASLDAPLETKLDLISAVDEYLFGYCMNERNNYADNDNEQGNQAMVDYVAALLQRGNYPALSALVGSYGLQRMWGLVHDHARDEGRFNRNLQRLLDGFDPRARR